MRKELCHVKTRKTGKAADRRNADLPGAVNGGQHVVLAAVGPHGLAARRVWPGRNGDDLPAPVSSSGGLGGEWGRSCFLRAQSLSGNPI